MRISCILLILAVSSLADTVNSQSLETYAGHKRFGVDLMWFKYLKDVKDEHTPFLFFSRNRASTDYDNAPTAFGSTNALSYNFKNGMGVVAVASFVNSGIIPKAGIQYFKQKKDFMFFGWVVVDAKSQGNIDVFGLFRYQPKLNQHWQLFNQLELFPIYNPSTEYWNITQRLRIGLKYHRWAFGFMVDFNQLGRDAFNNSENLGAFLRYEF